MEGVAALSLAANILQIVDFAQKLLSAGNEIYNTGSTVHNTELEVIVKDFELLARRLKSRARLIPSTVGPLNEDSQSLETLALESEKIVHQLIAVLTTLKLPDNASRYQSFRQAVRTAWNDKEIRETKARLSEIRAQLMFRLQVLSNDDLLESLDDATRQVLLAVVTTKDDLASRLQSSEESAVRRHNQLLQTIPVAPNMEMSPNRVFSQIDRLLRFPRQRDRYEGIAQAHQATFQWVLDQHANKHANWPDMYTWLSCEHGIYWISGKAGSGKSTLMKYLHQDPRLKEALTSWAGADRLLIVSFYFWNAGSDFQKSQEGLFRSIVHQVLTQEPSLAQSLFPEQFLEGANWYEFPTFLDVRRAFRRLVSCEDAPMKIALFVDGLDELDATNLTMGELAEMFITATTSPNVKAVLSSRPLAPFEFAFKSCPKLRLHQLTQGDITTYVHDKLIRDPRIATMDCYDAEGVHDLVEEIVNSAHGVFLWVTLVVRSLLEGFQNYDMIPDLQKRLRELPGDLEALFKHMLRNISERYKVESSQIFQMVMCIKERYQEHLPALLLRFVDVEDSFVLRASISPITDQRQLQYEEEIAGRLRSRCLGLLEVRPLDIGFLRPSESIEYLHRTVLEFLRKPEVWNDIVKATSGTKFDANTSLVRSIAMQAKDAPVRSTFWFRQLIAAIRKAMVFAACAESSTNKACTAVLDEIDRTMTEHWHRLLPLNVNDRYDSWHESFLGEHPSVDAVNCSSANFMALAVASGLTLYVRDKAYTQGSEIILKPGRPLLDYASDPRLTSLIIVTMLLESGADPNPIWLAALLGGTQHPPVWISTLMLLAQHKVDLDMTIEDDPEAPLRWYRPEYQEIRKVRKSSSLRFIKLTIGRILQERLRDRDRSMWYDFERPGEIAKFKATSDHLVQLLVSKGAKAEEWCKTGNQDWVRTFPKIATPQNDGSSKVLKVSKSEDTPQVQKKRSHLARIGARIHGLVYRKE